MVCLECNCSGQSVSTSLRTILTGSLLFGRSSINQDVLIILFVETVYSQTLKLKNYYSASTSSNFIMKHPLTYDL